MIIRLLTLNTHSLVEENYSRKLSDFVSAAATHKPQIIALQEVNQTACGAVADIEALKGYVPCGENITVREDNHVFNAAKLLREKGMEYSWTWLPMKRGYDKYDEGIALMSMSPIIETRVITVSAIDDYNNWKTRKIFGIRTEAAPDEWFFSVHYGWWDDTEEPFREQWKRTLAALPEAEKVWLMGDFNSPAEVRGEGYDMITYSGWHDSYRLAKEKDSGITVAKVIDGWQEKINLTEGMRIDQIWCSKKADISSSAVIFNGVNYPIVSDHYGVMIDYDRSEK